MAQRGQTQVDLDALLQAITLGFGLALALRAGEIDDV